MLMKLLLGHTDIPCDYRQQHWRNVTVAIYSYGGRTSILMTELYVGTTLTGFLETGIHENGIDLVRF